MDRREMLSRKQTAEATIAAALRLLQEATGLAPVAVDLVIEHKITGDKNILGVDITLQL